MSSEETGLFDSEPYETNKPHPLHETLGVVPNQFVNASRMVTLELVKPPVSVFTPSESPEPRYTSKGYAEESRFENGFRNWETIYPPRNEPYTAYLGGFPRLQAEDGTNIDCLHVWLLNSDVYAENYAIPFTALRGLFLHSKFQALLEAQIEELGHGDVQPLYEIPLLRDRISGETITVPASQEVLQEMVEKRAPDPQGIIVAPDTKVEKYKRSFHGALIEPIT